MQVSEIRDLSKTPAYLQQMQQMDFEQIFLMLTSAALELWNQRLVTLFSTQNLQRDELERIKDGKIATFGNKRELYLNIAATVLFMSGFAPLAESFNASGKFSEKIDAGINTAYDHQTKRGDNINALIDRLINSTENNHQKTVADRDSTIERWANTARAILNSSGG